MTMIESAQRADHEICSHLLPWYANETLEPGEKLMVEAHLADCGECQEDLALLGEMRSAVLEEDSSPISVPQNSAAVIESGAARKTPRPTTVAWRVAAMLLLALPLAWVVFKPAPNQQFETVTSEGQAATVQYVLELTFDPLLPPEDVNAMMLELGTPVTAAQDSAANRVIMTLAPRSLAELEAHAADIARRPGIESAKFVALQVPVR